MDGLRNAIPCEDIVVEKLDGMLSSGPLHLVGFEPFGEVVPTGQDVAPDMAPSFKGPRKSR